MSNVLDDTKQQQILALGRLGCSFRRIRRFAYTGPMAKRMIDRARRWRPKTDDPHGEDKRRLIDHLIENDITSENPIALTRLLGTLRFTQRYSREALQHNLLGPLRRDPRLFVGTSNKGIFLVTSRLDVDTTLGFYTSRIRA